MSQGADPRAPLEATADAGAIALSRAERAIVRAILRRCLPAGTVVRIFGSRAGATAKRMADLDLAIRLPTGHLDLATLARLADALEEPDLPFRVDLADLEQLPPEFLEGSRLLEVV